MLTRFGVRRNLISRVPFSTPLKKEEAGGATLARNVVLESTRMDAPSSFSLATRINSQRRRNGGKSFWRRLRIKDESLAAAHRAQMRVAVCKNKHDVLPSCSLYACLSFLLYVKANKKYVFCISKAFSVRLEMGNCYRS